MKSFGQILWWGSGILMFLLALYFFYQLWGGIGLLVPIVVVPVVVLLPAISLVVTGLSGFTILTAFLWLIGLVGILMSREPETPTTN